jgi:uncharacterized protein (TIGR02266 family)
MKTVLDLIGEFATLNDAKVRHGGTLPPEPEHRWEELKSFYDLLMAQNGLAKRPVTKRFSTSDIQKSVTSRERLRVPVELDMIINVNGDYQTVQVINVSRGGVFLASDKPCAVGTRMTLFIANAYGGGDGMFEAQGEVVWVSEFGIAESELPRGMGVHFVENREEVRRQLDAFVLETLEMRLSGVDANSLTPDFIDKEKLDL